MKLVMALDSGTRKELVRARNSAEKNEASVYDAARKQRDTQVAERFRFERDFERAMKQREREAVAPSN